MVHAGEEPLQNGQLPMSFILENQRLRHWVGDGTSPSDSMFDVVARQKLTMRDNHNMLKKSEPSRRQQLMGIDEEVKAHRKMMDDLKRATNFNQVSGTASEPLPRATNPNPNPNPNLNPARSRRVPWLVPLKCGRLLFSLCSWSWRR